MNISALDDIVHFLYDISWWNDRIDIILSEEILMYSFRGLFIVRRLCLIWISNAHNVIHSI